MECNMDYVSAIVGALPQIVGFGILLVVLKYGIIWSDRKKTHLTEGYKNISCDSPNCVRCRAYTVRSQNELRREWIEYTQTLSKSERERVTRISQTLDGWANLDNPDLRPTFELLHLQNTPFCDSETFVLDVCQLQASYRNILKEYQRISDENPNWKTNSTPKGRWKAFYLVNQGQTIEENVAECPETYKVLQNLQNFMNGCVYGNACFSVVYPGTQISEHYGPCNLRVRCHLGLDVPKGCELVVDGVNKFWEPGKCLLFDDSYLHSVAHYGSLENSGPRAVLLVDFWNSGISIQERVALTHLLGIQGEASTK